MPRKNALIALSVPEIRRLLWFLVWQKTVEQSAATGPVELTATVGLGAGTRSESNLQRSYGAPENEKASEQKGNDRPNEDHGFLRRAGQD